MISNKKIIVIGAGAWGGWTALHLQKSNADITLLDSYGPGNSRSGSGGESRAIRATYGADEIYSKMVFRSFEILDHYVAKWQTPLYHKTGALWLFQTPPHYGLASKKVLDKYDYHFEQLELKDAMSRFPQFNFEDVNDVFYEADAGFMEARKICQLLVRKYQEAGGQFNLAHAKLHKRSNGKLQSIITADGTILEADVFVFACGPWNKFLFPELFEKTIHISRQEVYYFGLPQTGASDFLSPKLPVWLDFDPAEILHYGMPDTKFRGFKVAYDIRDVEINPDTADRSPSPNIVERSRAFLAKRFPKLKDAPLIESRVCNYENALDGHFILDYHPELSNVLIAGGSSGHGYKMGAAMGELIAQHLLDEKELPEFFSLKRQFSNNDISSQFTM